MTCRVRIAPSPTGDPHVGTAYIALFNYALAHKNGGSFVLRIEDTDQTRSKPEWETMLVESLQWLGLNWDEGPDVGGDYGPYRQSERRGIYKEHINILLDKGLAYPCFCSAKRLAEMRQAQREAKQQPGYDGRCRQLDVAEARARMDKEPHVIRLKVPESGDITFKDELRGDVSISATQIDDQVLIKADGMPTYHFANVVDDHLMQITDVIRAEEWISSTPKHVLLYQAFEWDPPRFFHMPLLRNPDKSKISKRKNPVSLNYYREAGIYPEAMRNYLSLMGWSMPDEKEKFSLAEFIEHFDLSRISLGGPVFDQAKLTWLNGHYLREESVGALVERLEQGFLSKDYLLKVASLLQERVDRLDAFLPSALYFFQGEVEYDDAALKAMIPKNTEPKDARKRLLAVADAIDGVTELTEENSETILKAKLEEFSLKPRDLFMSIRVAVTGRKATPGLYETMAVLGKERCRQRLRMAAERLKSYKPAG